MALYRFGRGWSEQELRAYLDALTGRAVNFDDPPETMTVDHGWTIDGDRASLGSEPEGPPLIDGPFARARAGDHQLRLLRPADRGRPLRSRRPPRRARHAPG